jgi:hypothetical protein
MINPSNDDIYIQELLELDAIQELNEAPPLDTTHVYRYSNAQTQTKNEKIKPHKLHERERNRRSSKQSC